MRQRDGFTRLRVVKIINTSMRRKKIKELIVSFNFDSVRHRATKIVELLASDDLIRAERQKAKGSNASYPRKQIKVYWCVFVGYEEWWAGKQRGG